MAAARFAGASDLKIPEPMKTDSAPRGMQSAASAGGGNARPRSGGHAERGMGGSRSPAGGEVRDRKLPCTGDEPDELVRGAEPFRLGHELLTGQYREPADIPIHFEQVAHRLHDIPRARLPLGADERRPLADAPQGLAEIAAAADERNPERVLVDVVFLVRRRQHLTLIHK